MKKSSYLFLLIFLIPAAGAAAGYFFLLVPAQRIAENEKAAAAALKTLTAAEADFRANDRDGNHINDFWTGDVAGLFYVKSNEKGKEQEVRIIPRAIGEADTKPLEPMVPAPVPYSGYLFLALDEDEGLKGIPEAIYKQDTGGSPPMGRVHNTSKFGFCAYPAEYGVTGKFTFLINENNTVLRRDTGGKPMTQCPKD